jgi:uroporphyrinogen-III synthase/uroporphyrinogen III methyltransferase/synthase
LNPLPLAGRRVLVTRALHQAGKLSDGLRAQGAVPVEVPVLEIRPPASFEALDRALRQFDSYDWLLLTSANAVRALYERAQSLGVELVQAASMQVAAVGEGTASAARLSGLRITVVPESYLAESLLEALSGVMGRQSAVGRILLARASVARDVIPQALQNAGLSVDIVDAYCNGIPETAPEQLRHALEDGIAMATFTSSSSVTHLAEVARVAGISWPFASVAAVSIGPITSRTLLESGWPPAAEATPSDIPGLVAAAVRIAQSLQNEFLPLE